MQFKEFAAIVKAHNYSIHQLRCDVPPCQGIFELMDILGLPKYEQYVARLEQTTTKSAKPRK